MGPTKMSDTSSLPSSRRAFLGRKAWQPAHLPYACQVLTEVNTGVVAGGQGAVEAPVEATSLLDGNIAFEC